MFLDYLSKREEAPLQRLFRAGYLYRIFSDLTCPQQHGNMGCPAADR
jgi:hypothetical protein